MSLDDTQIARRDLFRNLLRGGVAALAGAILYAVFRHWRRPSDAEPGNLTVVAGRTEELAVNSGKIFQFGRHPALLILGPDGEYRAMSDICTHMGCALRYLPTMQQVWCSCHSGFFDLEGRVVSGPPPRPLERYLVQVRGSEIIVSRMPASGSPS